MTPALGAMRAGVRGGDHAETDGRLNTGTRYGDSEATMTSNVANLSGRTMA